LRRYVPHVVAEVVVGRPFASGQPGLRDPVRGHQRVLDEVAEEVFRVGGDSRPGID
jgi:hypothetical protein